MLNLGIHRNRHLQRAWNKYGKSVFEFRIVEIISGKEDILRAEQSWISFYMSKDNGKCYNISPVAGSVLGMKWSDESKKKQPERVKSSPRKTIEIARDCLIKKTRELHDAGKKMNTGFATFSSEKMKEINTLAHKNDTPESMAIRSSRLYVGFVSPDGTEFRDIFNLSKFCRKHGLCVTSMCYVNSGKLQSYKGWKRIGECK